MTKWVSKPIVAASVVALIALFWVVSNRQTTLVRWRESEAPRKIERFVENPGKVRFLPEGDVVRAEHAASGSYHWTGKDIERLWRKDVEEKYVTLRSPRLDFNSADEIDSIVIKVAALNGVTEFTLFWNDQPTLSYVPKVQNRRELRAFTKQSSAIFLIRGEDIYDIQFLGTETAEKPLRYLFLRFPLNGSTGVVFDSIQVVSSVARFATQPQGQGRLVLGGEVRDMLYIRTPGRIAYYADLPAGAELLFGVHSLARAAVVRYTVTVGMNGAVTLFDQRVEETGGWHDFSVPLPSGTGSVITLYAESDRPNNAAIWSNPMIVTRRQGSEPPNVILFVVDALRADRLSSYGYSKKTSPFLDELAKRGVVFRYCYAPASWTKPSVVTLMTSLYPQAHRVGARNYTDTVPDSVATLSDYMRLNGYITAQFSANPLSSTLSNLDQGFDYAFPPNSFRISDQEAKQNKIHSDDLNAKVLPWIEAHARRRFFLYIHSVDPHPPFYVAEISRHLVGRGEKSDLYDAGVYFNDQQIRRVYEKLSELGLTEKTLFIVTSDHGQAFNEHGQVGHGLSVYQEEIHVPLIMAHPGKLHPRVVDKPVQLIDVMPTVLDYCSIEMGRSNLQGTNVLAPLDTSQQDRQIFVSRFVYQLDAATEEFTGLGLYGVVENHWKLVVSEQKARPEPRFELYDLSTDPLERHDLSRKERGRVLRLYSALSKFLERQREERVDFLLHHDSPAHKIRLHKVQEGKPIPQDVIDRLRTLGYIR